MTADGKPFFWLGDTAWELFHRLSREEAAEYLQDRASKGFTVIQAVALAEYEFKRPNAYGHLPLQDDDPTRPLEPYFADMDWIISKAEEQGLYVGIVPAWGDKWNRKWGVGPEMFTPENARVFGEWLGRRYRNSAVIWILGADRPVESERHAAIIRAMARGIRRGDGGRHLITFHPQRDKPPSFHADDWLDIEMFQSGHFRYDSPVYEVVARDRALEPAKPVLNGEPCYEEAVVRSAQPEARFTDVDVRKAAYWSLLSGTCGHTYGHNSIWQFLGTPGFTPATHARTPWREALQHPGAVQMGLMKAFFTSLPWQQLEPDQSLLAGDAGTGGAHQVAACARNGTFAVVYVPRGGRVAVRLDRLGGPTVRATWFDPRSGSRTAAGDAPSETVRTFEAPNPETDWVLLLENASRPPEARRDKRS